MYGFNLDHRMWGYEYVPKSEKFFGKIRNNRENLEKIGSGKFEKFF